MGKKLDKKKKSSEVVVNIAITKQGEFLVTNGKAEPLQPLSPKELGKTLVGREITAAHSISITYLHSNPSWICIGGHWYFIP